MSFALGSNAHYYPFEAQCLWCIFEAVSSFLLQFLAAVAPASCGIFTTIGAMEFE